jgi:putative cell wall-binding protein
MNNMTTKEVTLATIDISHQYTQLATTISNELKKRLDQKEITFEHFVALHEQIVNPLIIQATKITFNSINQVAKELQPTFQEIKKGTEKLNADLDKISKVEKIITIAANILTSAALVAAFIAAPNPISAASVIAAIANLVDSLEADDKDEEDSDAKDDDSDDKVDGE